MACPPGQTADGRATLTRLGQVLLDRVCEVVHRHRLKPDPARPCQRGQEEPRATEERVLDAGNCRDVERDRLLEHADMPRVDAQRVAWLQVVNDHLAVQLHPRRSLTLQPLHAKAGASEDPGTQSLLEPDRELHADGGAHETVAVDHVTLAWG